MDLRELGIMLRREREKQNLSIEDVMHRTKISRRNITALEEGDEGRLPHPVYAKGFVKTYAQVLGLDADEVSSDFAKTLCPDEEEVCLTQEIESSLQSGEPMGGPRKLPLILILVLFALLVGGVIYYFSTPEDHTRDMASPEVTAPEIEAVPEEDIEPPGAAEPLTDEPADSVEPPEVEEPMESLDFPESVEPIPEPEAVEPVEPEETAPEEEPEVIDEPEEAVGSDEEVVPGPVESPVRNTLNIEAEEPCWLRADFNGQTRDVFLRPGESIEFQFFESLVIRLGNAGGVSLTYNGRPVELQAESGQTQTLTFPNDQQ